MNENEIFKTKDFYLTAFLKAKEMNVVKVKDAIKKNEFYFCFTKSQIILDMVNNFYSGGSKIETTRFINAIRDLKALIYSLKN